MKTFRLALALALALFASTTLAQTIVKQGNGSASVIPWRMTVTTSTGTVMIGNAPAVTAGAPAAVVSVTTGPSAAATGLTAGATYRVACSGDVFFRTGSGTPVAVVTDTPIYGPAVEYLTLATGSTAFAFITASGTASCVLTLITAAP